MPVSRTADLAEPKQSRPDDRELGSKVLTTIEAEAHRPGAIVNILRGKYSRNAVIKALIDLEKDGKAERTGSKAWIAKGKVTSKDKDSKKEKAKSKKE